MAPIQQVQAVLVVVFHHVLPVVFHGVAARALVEHGADVVRNEVFAHLADEFVFVEIMRDVAIGKVAEFVPVGQVVHGDDVGFAAPVERFDDVATDKAGCACYDDGHD